MKDYLEQEISVGDTIVACMAHGRNSGASFSKGTVTKLTEKTVFFDGPDYTGTYVRNRKVSPYKVIVIKE